MSSFDRWVARMSGHGLDAGDLIGVFAAHEWCSRG